MLSTQTSPEYHANAAMNHERAASHHDQAAEQHRKAARVHATGDYEAAERFGRQAELSGAQAKHCCERALQHERYASREYGSNAKKMYLHRCHPV